MPRSEKISFENGYEFFLHTLVFTQIVEIFPDSVEPKIIYESFEKSPNIYLPSLVWEVKIKGEIKGKIYILC